MKTSSSIYEKHAAARKIVRKEKLTPLKPPLIVYCVAPTAAQQAMNVYCESLHRLATMNLKLAEVFEIPTSGAETGYDAIQGHDNHIQVLTGRSNPNSIHRTAVNLELDSWMKTHLAQRSTAAAMALKKVPTSSSPSPWSMIPFTLWPFDSSTVTHPILVDAMGDYVIELFAHLYARLQALGLR